MILVWGNRGNTADPIESMSRIHLHDSARAEDPVSFLTLIIRRTRRVGGIQTQPFQSERELLIRDGLIDRPDQPLHTPQLRRAERVGGLLEVLDVVHR